MVVLLSSTVACLGLGNKLLDDKVMLNAFGWELILLLHIRLAWVGLKLFSGALRTPPCESYSLFVLLPFCCPSEQLLMILMKACFVNCKSPLASMGIDRCQLRSNVIAKEFNNSRCILTASYARKPFQDDLSHIEIAVHCYHYSTSCTYWFKVFRTQIMNFRMYLTLKFLYFRRAYFRRAYHFRMYAT